MDVVAPLAATISDEVREKPMADSKGLKRLR
jgi:hypothetical protein